jgi:hypothetical protein
LGADAADLRAFLRDRRHVDEQRQVERDFRYVAAGEANERDEQENHCQRNADSKPSATGEWRALTPRKFLLAHYPFARARVESGHVVG